MEDPDSEKFVKELTDLARRSISLELVNKFDALLAETDKLWEESQKRTIEEWIGHKRLLPQEEP
jgi:hypothetical protein